MSIIILLTRKKLNLISKVTFWSQILWLLWIKEAGISAGSLLCQSQQFPCVSHPAENPSQVHPSSWLAGDQNGKQ